MKILHITTPAGFGGLESVVEMLTRGMLDRGHDVTVMAIVEPGPEPHPFLVRLTSHRIPCLHVSATSRDYAGERRAVRDAVTRLRPDVAHTHGYRADVVDAGAARSAGAATASTVHGFTGGGFKNRVFEWMQVRSYRTTDSIAAASQPIVERLALAGVSRAAIHLVRNSYRPSAAPLSREDARALLGLAEGGFHVGWVGRLSAEKGPDVMLEAARQLCNQGVTTSFVGDGAMLEKLRALAPERGPESGILFHGTVPDAGRLTAAFDVLAISSRTEGTPIVLLEAIAARTPVVATRVGGIPDVISEKEAVLVSSDNPRELADGIILLKSQPALAMQLASAAAARVERELSYDKWLDAYEQVYESAIASRRRKG